MNAPASASPLHRQPHPSPQHSLVGAWARWFSLLGAPLAWSLQELVDVPLAGYACYPHDVPLPAPLWNHLATVSAGVEGAAALVCVAAGLTAWRSWRRSRDETPGNAHRLVESGDGRTRFMAMVGMMTSGMFLVAIGFASLTLATPPCGG